jgi:hypothetical protein
MKRAGVVLLAGGLSIAAHAASAQSPDAQTQVSAAAEVAMQSRGSDIPPGFALSYDVYKSGLRAIRFDFSVSTDPATSDYRTQVQLETAGLVGMLFGWSLEASSEGGWRMGEIVPERYRTANVWRGRERTVSIDYNGGFAQRVSSDPPYSREDVEKVAPEMISGAVDPTTAVTALVFEAALGGGCRPRTAVYDGRRRYDAHLAALPDRELAPSNYAPFSGIAEGCRLTFERIAGFRPDRKRLQDLQVDVWLAEVGIEGTKVPVRLELATPWGDGFAHLVAARRGDGALVFGSEDDDG